MSTLQRRGSLALVAILVALGSYCPVQAQVGGDFRPFRPQDGAFNQLNIGVTYDRVNQAKAERNLRFHEEKLKRDAANCKTGAEHHDIRRIGALKYRIAVDEWLIRKNLTGELYGYPPLTDPVSAVAIAQAATPAPFIDSVQVTPPTDSATAALAPAPAPSTPITITIVNTARPELTVSFAIDGVAYQAAGGSRQDYSVTSDSNITFDGGGSVGARRYVVSSGVYEFRSTAGAWVLYKLPATP